MIELTYKSSLEDYLSEFKSDPNYIDSPVEWFALFGKNKQIKDEFLALTIGRPNRYIGWPHYEKFLDYSIINSGNGDGFVLLKEDCNLLTPSGSYQMHLGNYSNPITAKKDALYYFMIARPQLFATAIVNKLRRTGSGCWGEFNLIQRCLIKEGIELPKEITSSADNNFMIMFEGEVI